MKYVVILISFLSLMSCTKSTTDCTYLITCTEQIVKDGEKLPLTDVVGFAFYADTASYTPKSYVEALSGTISDKSGAKTIKADVVGVFDPATALLTMPNLSKKGKSVFVVCDIKNQIYSFRQYTIEQNLPQIITTLESLPYMFINKPGEIVKTLGWIQSR